LGDGSVASTLTLSGTYLLTLDSNDVTVISPDPVSGEISYFGTFNS